LSELTAYFYDKNYKVEFVDQPPLAFADTLLEQIKTAKTSTAAELAESSKLNAFLMYAKKDQATKAMLDNHLSALKRNQIIETWNEEEILAGSIREDVIAEKIQQADIILLLLTSDFISSDDIYEKQLQKALQRHKDEETTIIPILMKSCLWESSVIGDLSATMLPWKNKTPLLEQADPAAGLKDTVQKLEDWCAKIYKIKTNKRPE